MLFKALTNKYSLLKFLIFFREFNRVYNIDIVKELLIYPKLDINQQDSDGNTALIHTCFHNNIKIVKELLNRSDINVNIQERLNKTSLYYAKIHKNQEMIYIY